MVSFLLNIALGTQGKFSADLPPMPKSLPYRDWRKMRLPRIAVDAKPNLVPNPSFEDPINNGPVQWFSLTDDYGLDGKEDFNPKPEGHRSNPGYRGKYSFDFDALDPVAHQYDPKKVVRWVKVVTYMQAPISSGDIGEMGVWVRVQGKATLHANVYYDGAEISADKALTVNNVGKTPKWQYWSFKGALDPYKMVYGIRFYVRSDETPYSKANPPFVRIDSVVLSPK